VKVITSIDDAIASVGQPLGVSDWKEIDQTRIDAFADVTEDHQWIHVDTERAAAQGPYGATIAHGFLTLSLIPVLCQQNYRVENRKMGLNYGLNRVRFLAPVVEGSRVRVRSELLDVTKVADDSDTVAVNLTIRNTVELDGSDKPAAVADMITRVVF
jgi:acyl dehydratase